MRVVVGIWLMAFLVMSLDATCLAAPNLINYQGVLTDSAGIAVSGAAEITFALFDAETGGSELWTEHQQVQVQNGSYNVLLGASTPFPAELFADDSRWLEVRVGPLGSEEVLTPRQQMVSVPFSRSAQNAVHATHADLLGGVAVSGFGTAADLAAAQAEIGSLQTTVSDLQTVISNLSQPAPVGGNGNAQAITRYHGTAVMNNLDALAGKTQINVTITAAAASVDGAATVDFSVTDKDGLPVTDLSGARLAIARLEPASGVERASRWVPYIYRAETVTGNEFPNPAGTQTDQAFFETNGDLTNHGDGSYSYLFATDLSTVVTPVGAEAVGYDRSRTHRIAVLAGGSSGRTGDAVFDFVPDGSPVALARNLAATAACLECHGPDIPGHDGSGRSVESCVTCHTPGSLDAQSGASLDFKVMMHRIHAGGELPSIPGPDGLVWDNPATPFDETADNGSYALWGDGDVKHTWWKSRFPAVLANCIKCHQGGGSEVDNWKTVPSRTVCGSCHEDVDFVLGTNHPGGPQASDTNCSICHPSIGPGLGQSVTDAHDWTLKDERNIPEFNIDMSISLPANGVYFVSGEAPVVTLVIKENGSPIDHTTVAQDTNGAEGCTAPGPCPPRDGLFTAAYLFVHGPRAKRNPVLTSVARVSIQALSTGPFDLSGGGSLSMVFDGGQEIRTKTAVMPGSVTVELGTGAATTAQQIVDALNADTNFAARGIAYLDQASGRPAIRSRNLGDFFSLQLLDGPVTTAVFGGDTTQHTINTTYPRNDLFQHADPSNDDPKVIWLADRIEYVLDPVDDLPPGTYVASVEIADRGRLSTTNYKTPSVATLTFQVKQPAAEFPPAASCGSCHQGPDGRGFVADLTRHNKILGDDALDQCGACHDDQPRTGTGPWGLTPTSSQLLHAVHAGSSLNFPQAAAGTFDRVAGRNWEIYFPQDIRYCESCHPTGTSSGSWMTNAMRLPCMGCHDATAATTHMKINTYDPTPADPWSGDEQESCRTCH